MSYRIKKAIKILLNKDKKKLSQADLLQSERVKPWLAINGDQYLRLNYELNSRSVVFDIGGYKGEFATSIFCKYNSHVYVFEPVKDYFAVIEDKFSHNDKVIPYNFGLGGIEEDIQITLQGDSSSIFLEGGKKETIKVKSITNFIKSNNIKNIDLMKINIEGGEYDLLETLLSGDEIKIVKNIQVQFHDFLINDANEKMTKLQEKLALTHDLTYQYEFVWENWKLKSNV